MIDEAIIRAARRMAEVKLRGGEPPGSVESHLRLYLHGMGASELERDMLAQDAVRAVAPETDGSGRGTPS